MASRRLVRIYQSLDLKDVTKHLLIYGAISGTCAHCNKLGVKLENLKCPQCGMEFKYISFQNVREHLPKLQKIQAERPGITLIDYEDYKRLTGEIKAQEFLK